MGFAFAGLLRLRLPPGFKIIILGVAGSALACGFVPSIQYIYGKTKSPFSVYHFAQAEVAASRFLKNIVAGREPTNPHLERDELKRHEGPDALCDTLICPQMAYSILHLFLHDYGDQEILSFCGGSPMFVMSQQDIWRLNKKAIANYVPQGRDLKLIWQIEDPPKIDKIIKMYEPLRQLAKEQTISYSLSAVMHLEANPNSTCWIFPARTSRSFRNGCGIYLIFLSPQLNLRHRLRPCRFLASGLHVLVRCNNAISAVPSRSDSGLMVFTIMAPLPAECFALTQPSAIRSMA